MDLELFREYCLAKKGVTEELPFGPDVLVFKVMGKVFALVPLDEQDLRVSLKNTPDKNEELRAEHAGITGAFHMNKTHWSTFFMRDGVSAALLKACTDDSYRLVIKGMTKKLQAELAAL
jgi:predicted DNA-binding protein (MmcQ/YjbR family)